MGQRAFLIKLAITNNTNHLMSEFFDQVFCESNKEFSLIVEDNGKVAYAYLLQQKKHNRRYMAL